MSNTEFGRRRPAQKAGPASASPSASSAAKGEAEEGGFIDTLFSSPLTGQLAGILGGVVIVALVITMYVTTMKGMGRALNDSWEKKATITPMIGEPDPSAPFARGPCSVNSFNAEFRRVQKELGC
jgi:hypothetical protein